MTVFPVSCPYCGSYDIEWLSELELRCLNCGAVFPNPRLGRRFSSQDRENENLNGTNGE